jgi:hypothetical protein
VEKDRDPRRLNWLVPTALAFLFSFAVIVVVVVGLTLASGGFYAD